MSGFLSAFAAGLSAIESNQTVKQYAEPVLLAIFTGASVIVIPEGVITISQSGIATRFSFGTALMALEAFILTNQTEIQVGTTIVSFAPNATKQVPLPISA